MTPFQSLPHGYRLKGKKNEYIIDHTLGQGAFGITYLAKYKTMVMGQIGSGSAWVQVCIKEFFMRDLSGRKESTGSLHEATGNSLVSRYRRAFLREANNLARMQHPNIVNVFEVIEANNTAYIVMEYIDGGNLDDYITRKGHLTEEEALCLFHPICDAMNYMHAQHILHLDLKPKNVMLDEAGKPYLIDFGLSKQYTEDGEPESSTTIGLGTPGYAPSEQAEQRDGDKTFRSTIDVYALGGTLYKMLTGNTPPKATEISEAVLDGTNLVLEKLRTAGVSQTTSSVISKAMYPSSRKRYQSVEELMTALGWRQEKENQETTFIKKEDASHSTKSSSSTFQDEETRIISQQSPIPPQQPSVTIKQPHTQTTPPQEWEQMMGQVQEKKPKHSSAIWWVFGIFCVILLLGIIRTCEISHTAQTKPVPTQPTRTAANASSTQRSTPTASSTVTGVKYGSLMVTSEPSGATIYLNGKPTDKTTPDVLEKLTPGNHIIHLTLYGYEPQTKTVTIKEGSNPNLKVTLKTKPVSQPVQKQTNQQPPQKSNQQSSQQSIPSKTSTHNGHEYVDLGLSVMWATCNVGASTPSAYGNYYAWGETTTKSDYSWGTLKYCTDSSGDRFSKYVTDSKYGTVDNKRTLEMSDDAARANWGGSWRMPTDAEWTELRNKCTWTWTSQGGHNGFKVTSLSNGNSIFLPAAGHRETSLLFADGMGSYWSSMLRADMPWLAWGVFMAADSNGRPHVDDSGYGGYRYYGLSVRPVCP